MPRQGRKHGEAGYYHVILRGIDRQEIFHDDEDREKFIDVLIRYTGELGVTMIAYCLMDNHVHMLMKATDGPAFLVKKMASSYVYYFNHKYERVGHLFQERYKSEAVETDEYLLTAARYILQNPMKAGICRTVAYPWSSWNQTETGDGFCDTETLCELTGNREALLNFMKKRNEDHCLEVGAGKTLTDAEVSRLVCEIARVEQPVSIQSLEKEEKLRVLVEAKRAGGSVRQLARLTGVNRNTIQRS